MLIFASLWIFLLVFPLGWFLLTRMDRVRPDFQPDEKGPSFGAIGGAGLAVALLIEIMGIWYEKPILFYLGTYLVIAGELLWSAKEIAFRQGKSVSQEALSSEKGERLKKLVGVFLFLGLVPLPFLL